MIAVQRGMRLVASALARAGRPLGLFLVLAGCAVPAYAGAGPPPSAPEIDPGSVVSALTLLSGGVLLLTDRLRRK